MPSAKLLGREDEEVAPWCTYRVSKKEVYIFSHRLQTSVFQIFGSNLRSRISTRVNLMFLFNIWNFPSNTFIIFTNLNTSKTTKFEWVRIYSSIWSSWRCSESYADQFICKMDDCSVKTLAKSFVKQKRDYFKDFWKLKKMTKKFFITSKFVIFYCLAKDIKFTHVRILDF